MLGTSQTYVNCFLFLIFYNKEKSGDGIPKIAPEFQTLSFFMHVYLVYNQKLIITIFKIIKI